jgi:hypothetical protein
MIRAVSRAIVLLLYQLSIITGIALLPVALVIRQVGLSLPVNRIVDRLGAVYLATGENTDT